MKKKIKFISVSFLMMFAFMASILTSKVFATEFGEGDHWLSMDLIYEGVDINSVTINGSNWTSQNDVFKTGGENGSYTIVISAKSNSEENYAVRLNSQAMAIPDPVVDDNDVYTYTVNLNNSQLEWNHPENSDNHTTFISFGIDTYRPVIDNDENDPQGPHVWDDGAVYFVWADGDAEEGNFYYHKIIDVVGGGTMNYVPVSTVTYDEDETIKYNISNRERISHHDNQVDSKKVQSYEFVWAPRDVEANPDCFENLKDTNGFKNLTTTEKFDYLFENGLTVNPIRALNGANCVSTMGDLGFKLTIYNDAQETYEGVKVGVPENYTYYPSFWDGVFHWDIVDISNTTLNDPATFEAFLLERTLQIRNSDNIISRNIVSVEPINVPNKAVTVTQDPEDETVWNITYNSNYYDEVKFKITDSAQKVYYIIIQRVNVLIKRLMTDPTGLYAALYYPSQDSYEDYQLILKTNYKDGTSTTKVLTTPVRGIEGENGDIQDVYEMSGGENLKTAWYKLSGITGGPNSNVSNFFITVVRNYAPDSQYSNGVLAGSGDGIEFKDFGNGFRRVIKEG